MSRSPGGVPGGHPSGPRRPYVPGMAHPAGYPPLGSTPSPPATAAPPYGPPYPSPPSSSYALDQTTSFPMNPIAKSTTSLVPEKHHVKTGTTPQDTGSTDDPRPKKPSFSNDPMDYLIRHQVTGPMLGWLDFFSPDINKRYLKSPGYVKFGTKTANNQADRSRYAWYKLLSWKLEKRGGLRMRDGFDRVQSRIDKDERYISSYDGGFKELVVQCTNDVFEQRNDAPWTRARMTHLSPVALRMADWCAWNSKSTNGVSNERRMMRRIVGTILFLLPIPTGRSPIGKEHTGYYRSFGYKLLGYARVSCNEVESWHRWVGPNGTGLSQPAGLVAQTRAIGPGKLCKIFWAESKFKDEVEDEDISGATVESIRVDNWDAHITREPFPEYVFVAYVQSQFPKHKEAELHRFAMQAARDAGVDHYWLACACMDSAEDIYRISDYVRASKAVAIAISSTQQTNDSLELLRQFGGRVWTLPEVLLAPQKDNIFMVYHAKGVMKFTRYQIVRDIWTDAETSRQLVEHFEGSLLLNRLELSIIALRTFYNRDRGPMYNGDREYALMGLLRQRVQVNPDHDPFEAFASLSLMADNDRLLERLICIQPKTHDQDWNIMDDAYGCKLWDVHPSCQISGIGHGTKYQGYKHDAAKGIDQLRHTVIIDGLYGAQVRWKSFERVALRHGNSLVRSVITRLIAWSAYTFWIGLALVIISTKWAMAMVSSESYYGDDYYPTESYFDINGIVTALLMMALAIILFLMGVASIVFRPEFLITRWGGKKWGNQPWLFGVEGHCDIGEIESKLFGVNHGHLKWDAFGSPLSRHAPNEFGEVEGVDPMERADVRAYVQQVRARGDTRIFMLVDTNIMTVTLFEAARPPIAFLLAGSEGGMQRAIGVSMDWTTNTLYRECVLRMDTRVLESMPRVSRVRLGLRRED